MCTKESLPLVKLVSSGSNQRGATEDNGQAISKCSRSIRGNKDLLIDGGIVERTSPCQEELHSDRKFWTAPKLTEDEALYIYFEGENHYKPIFNATTEEKSTPVVFDDMVAKASSDYVKAHLAREVDNDLTQYQSYIAMYAKGRAQVFLNEKEYQSSSVEQVIGSGVGGGGFIIG